MAYYSTHGISQFLLNNEKQRVRFLLARPVYITLLLVVIGGAGRACLFWLGLTAWHRKHAYATECLLICFALSYLTGNRACQAVVCETMCLQTACKSLV